MTISDFPVVTIDGPAASGKGAVSSALALSLGFHYLESGLLYRALAWVAWQDDFFQFSEEKLVSSLLSLNLSWNAVGFPQIEGYTLPHDLHIPEVSRFASRISCFPEIREALIPLQRECQRDPGLVADGRDMGISIFPSAVLKVFLTAELDVRTKRRFLQLKQKGMYVTMKTVREDIQRRDFFDKTRYGSSFRVADDGFLVDSTFLSLEKTVAWIRERFHQLVF